MEAAPESERCKLETFAAEEKTDYRLRVVHRGPRAKGVPAGTVTAVSMRAGSLQSAELGGTVSKSLTP